MQENDKHSREEIAEGHGLDLAYLRETGERCGFTIPKGTPVKSRGRTTHPHSRQGTRIPR